MLFNSLTFFVFFALVFLLYLFLPHRGQNRLLLAASYLFYGAWDWRFLFLLAFTTTTDYWIGQALAGATSLRARKGWVAASAVLDLGILGFFKYFDFFADSLAVLLESLGFHASLPLLRIVLPVGISFFTFQALSYVVDVHRRRVAPARSWLDFANYLAFFPQLVAGPIVRAADLVPQMERMPDRAEPIEASRAVFLILGGLFKKTVVANWLATRLADPVFAWPERFAGPDALLGVYAYAVQIYCDFSAYSDLAIGTALLLGFRFPANFDAPYFATTLQDFWRRIRSAPRSRPSRPRSA